MPIVSGIICRGNEKVGEYSYPEATKIAFNVMEKILPKIMGSSSHKKSLQQQEFEIHYIFDDQNQNTYFCISKEETPKRICFSFLEDLSSEFVNLNSFSNLKKLIQEKIVFYNNPQNDKIQNVKKKVDEVKDVMINNIESVIDRGEKIEDLVEKSESVSESSLLFNRSSKKLKNAMIFRLIFLIFIIIFIIFMVGLFLIIILLFVVCGVTFENCFPPSKK